MGDGLATSRLCTASRRLYPQPTIHPCRTSLWVRLCSRAPDSWRNQHHNLAQAPLAGLSTPIHLRCAPQSSHRGLQASTTAPTHADPTFHNIRATHFGRIMLCPNLPDGHSWLSHPKTYNLMAGCAQHILDVVSTKRHQPHLVRSHMQRHLQTSVKNRAT